eukprot:CAMPEP_0206528730 /NCGR_PEP_ID=MMETSP0325_2-20121206/2158_1 /ASSEMBLY_ACC=CAM_ASM_000347 /TAXON_ID=2866 /ORGANISM="Crypthecodinium cohnii, Strain Seligo" /LENGTH=121 /DNA_ID=CAMNT_0054024467 /DNA_START=44 /DNA_END=409 /DNA_ORIENTATION=-
MTGAPACLLALAELYMTGAPACLLALAELYMTGAEAGAAFWRATMAKALESLPSNLIGNKAATGSLEAVTQEQQGCSIPCCQRWGEHGSAVGWVHIHRGCTSCETAFCTLRTGKIWGKVQG